MDSILKCFGDVVGLTKNHPTDSGLYITDLEALSTIDGLVIAEVGSDIEEVLEDARRIAILKLNSDLTSLMMRYASPRRPYYGKIGSTNWLTSRSEIGQSGIRLFCAPIKNAYLQINSINMMFAQTGTVPVYIASNVSDDILEFDLATVANKVKKNAIVVEETSTDEDTDSETITQSSLILPLYNDEATFTEYYIYHENPYRFLDNKLVCSSCKKFYFNTDLPKFQNVGYQNYMMVGGYNGVLSKYAVNSTKGMTLDVGITCRIDNVICNGELNFLSNPFAQNMAQAIQYKAGSVVAWNLQRNTNLNRVVMGDIEVLREAASYYERIYNDMIRHMAKNFKIESDCICEHGFTKSWVGEIA